MKKILICIAKIILVIIVLFTKLFYWHRSVILHLGAGLRYGSLRIFRPKQKISSLVSNKNGRVKNLIKQSIKKGTIEFFDIIEISLIEQVT